MPRSHFVSGTSRLHFLEWNPRGRACVVLLHGNSANAWWWEPLAALADQDELRLVALDLRGHGDSEWVRPPAYKPVDYAADLERLIDGAGLPRPV
ncbi:MAG: alpha/beta fold hydrolase, partial [Candidatus Binataceae bacterium]